MKSPEYEDLKNRIEQLEIEITDAADFDENELADRLYEIENELNYQIENSTDEREFNAYEKLRLRIKKIIQDHGFFDEETEYEILRNDINDSDYDPFSISGDDIFGDD